MALLLLFTAQAWAIPDSDPLDSATLVVSASVAKRVEIWDRRSNPLMGRPDFLKEILLQVEVLQVITAALPLNADRITISIKRENKLIASRVLYEGTNGVFYLKGTQPLFELITVNNVLLPKVRPIVRPLIQNQLVKPTPVARLPFPENIGGREMEASKDLQKKAVQVISKKYGMTKARILFLTSHSGPCPPEGGYLYWGVKGQIKGKWHIWQPGNNGRIFPGEDLVDPKRHQK